MAKANHISAHDFPHGPKLWKGGLIKFMARSGGYVMVRRPRAMPFVITEREWCDLPELIDAQAS